MKHCFVKFARIMTNVWSKWKKLHYLSFSASHVTFKSKNKNLLSMIFHGEVTHPPTDCVILCFSHLVQSRVPAQTIFSYIIIVQFRIWILWKINAILPKRDIVNLPTNASQFKLRMNLTQEHGLPHLKIHNFWQAWF